MNKSIIVPNNSERVFTELCNYSYLKGFVFHRPKIEEPTEIEIGDVLLWARTLLIDFELKWRNPKSSNISSFIKKIGIKRDQLERDYHFFRTAKNEILLKNENNNIIRYNNKTFDSRNFIGVVLLDFPETINLKYCTVKKSFELPFSLCFITFNGLVNILHEVDTIYDLAFYLKDRFIFFKYLFKNHFATTLELNSDIEKNLLAYYKINNNKFNEELWDNDNRYRYWNKYQSEFQEKIKNRNEENKKSYLIDRLINHLFSKHKDITQLPLHAWELSTFTRRQRAVALADKLSNAFERLKAGNKKRYFSFLNQTTGCWLLFYFHYGGTTETFMNELDNLCKLKTIYEVEYNRFNFSVFGYGFRKSELSLNTEFDEVYLNVEDAKNHKSSRTSLKAQASKMFGAISQTEIDEFPN